MDAFELGQQAMQAGDFLTARTHFAASTDPHALTTRGQLASQGLGEPADPAKAAQLYRRAADAGDGQGALNLGALHYLGRGMAQDLDGAMRWYLRAAELGNADAMQRIGLMHRTGDGFPVDPAEAERWWTRAAELGQATAMVGLAELAVERGDEEGASAWYVRAAEAGDTGTMAGLGEASAGMDDHVGALAWFLRAAEAGDVGAMFRVARCYRDGVGCTPDPRKAVRWFMEPMKHGNGDGMHEAHLIMDKLTPEQAGIPESAQAFWRFHTGQQ